MNNEVRTYAPPSDIAVRKFETRVGLTASGSKFCDGWILAVIGIVLPLASGSLGFTVLWESLIGSASLVGLFLGGLIFGRLADVYGRKMIFSITLLSFLACSILQFFVTGEVQLFVLRFLMGIAIGADYSIAGPMIAEFTSKRRRGPFLAGMMVWWYAGFSISAVLSLALLALLPANDDLWRWILASSFLPSLLVFIARIGLPESPRWLASHGRPDEALHIAERYLSHETREDVFKEISSPSGYSALFTATHIRKTLLTSIFWMAQVTPFFAIYTFLPRVMEVLDLGLDDSWAQVALYGFLLVGSLIGTSMINTIGRRRLLTIPFAVSAGALLILGVWPTAPAAVIVACFIVFAFFNAASSVLQQLYPSELFPTDIRATGVGFAAAMSRVGAAAGTFLLPLALASLGIGPVMIISAGVLVVGFIVSHLWAPETTGLALSQSSGKVAEKHKSKRNGV